MKATRAAVRHRADAAFRVLALGTLLVALVTLAALVIDVLIDGAGRLDWQFLTSLASRRPADAGIYHALAGSIWVIVLTAALALLVISIVVIYGVVKHGTHFFGLFVPSGVPGWLLPFMVLIEAVSFLSRPVSLSLRLFGNMLAGHIALKVFGGFVVVLLGSGAALNYAIAPLPLLLAVALTALEVLVAVLQAYVFAILTCIYLNEALHLHDHH